MCVCGVSVYMFICVFVRCMCICVYVCTMGREGPVLQNVGHSPTPSDILLPTDPILEQPCGFSAPR